MISSSSAMSAPAHPEPDKDEPATVDDGHPQIEPGAYEEITDQRQRRNGEAEADERGADPEAGDGVDHHGVERPERRELAWREVTERDAEEQPERAIQQECQQHPAVEGADAGPGISEHADRERSQNSGNINRDQRVQISPDRRPHLRQ